MTLVEPSSAEFKALIKKRNSYTKFVASSVKFVKNFDTNSKSCRQIKLRLDEVVKTMEKYDEVQTKIEEIDERPDVQDNERLSFLDECNEVRALMLDIIDDYEKATVNNCRTSTTLSSMSRDCGFVKLPSVPAPTFNGSLQDWPSFIDSFNAMFHENLNIATVQKFHYLKSCLVGSAADIVKTIPTTAENYVQAYEALISRYENKTLIVQSHIRSLFDTPKIEKASAFDLRQLHHHVTSHVRSLEALGQPTQHWDAWLVTLVCSRLDNVTVGEWQLRQSSKELPRYSDIEKFLASRVTAFEAGEAANQQVLRANKSIRPRQLNTALDKFTEKRTLFTKSNVDVKCFICDGDHQISHCKEFLSMTVEDRKAAVFKFKLCYNCLRHNHQVRQCRFSPCNKCAKKHNNLLHQEIQNYPTIKSSTSGEVNPSTSPQSVLVGTTNASLSVQANAMVMLATVVVEVCDDIGNMVPCRAVLDSGSQVNFVTSHCVKRLGLHRVDAAVPVSGIGHVNAKSLQYCAAEVHSRVEDVQFNVKLHVLPSITSPLPTQGFNLDKFVIPDHVQNKLADPGYNKPGNIDMLLGAELFFDIVKADKHVISEHSAFQNTVFGWILTGQVVTSGKVVSNPVKCTSSALSLFSSTSAKDIAEEEEVERHFQSTVVRTNEGRFMVRLPLKSHPDVIGNTMSMAKRRFFNLEAKLMKNPVVAKQYDDFMSEYLKLGHMQPVTNGSSSKVSYYLPHHAVIKNNSSTTKLRVVFDASATGSSGMSLNNIMLKGPTVQPTLHSILLRFRIHKFALTADIEKMYRQILVHPDDCELQKILYRSSPSEHLKEFTLQTVTYGTKAAPYLATRCLSQLGSEACRPSTQRTICEDFYVDDLLSGGESIDDCFNMYNDLSTTLLSAGMSLRKWCTNSSALSDKLATPEQDQNYLLKLDENDTVSTLGVTWNPHADCFQFIVGDWMPPVYMTKRTLLADINKVYDPLGFISPVLIKGKIFVQKLWLLKLGWDTSVPKELQDQWTRFYGELRDLEALRIPRRVMYSRERIELHGFSDASQEAFGACVYLKTTDDNGKAVVLLYTSKSRVAPTNKQTTIPRLELCGAVLLMEIVVDVIDELRRLEIQINQSSIVLWTDSTIVLSWIKTSQPLKSYVANRVARILDHSVQTQWKHVPTNENPADIISRGTSAKSIKTNSLWWNGPQWLLSSKSAWPSTVTAGDEDVPEVRCIKFTLSAVCTSNPVLDRYSEWNVLIRTTGWLQRFCNNTKATKGTLLTKRCGPLTVTELVNARTVWLRFVQSIEFQEELAMLRKKEPVSSKSRLKSLNPFIDQDGLIRVGGRLSLSNLSDQKKFPIVLPPSHKITLMIFEYEHKRLLHAGPQALLANLQIQFWPLRGRDTARRTVHKCITCFRHHPTTSTPFMAPLPRQRTCIDRPFTHTGVDFCGPVSVRSGIRRVTSTKAYISVFVCFTTRSIHLELVNGLTSNAFIAALKRFIGRRGSPQHMYSDNGTNFVGANRELKSYIQQLHKDYHLDKSIKFSGIQWHFNPPATPHLGGLWESAVKSTKTHLLKSTKGALFTFEELTTLLCQIEAVLNSRPMTPLSTDPSDYSALTPAHFLIGSPLTQVLEPTTTTEPKSRLKRWELVRFQAQQFWKRWSQEYLPQLQCRGRWIKVIRNVKVGDLCLIRKETLPPTKWALARVQSVHPGIDGTVRVVTLRNSAGAIFQRPVTKLAILPTEEDELEGQSTSSIM